MLHLSEDSFSVDHYCNCFSTVFVQETGVYRQILSLGTVSNYKNTQFLRRPAPSVTKNDISRIKRGRSAGVKETGNKILKDLKKYISKIKINKRKPFFGHFGSKKTYLVMVATSLVMVATSLVMVATSLVMAVQFNHLSNHEWSKLILNPAVTKVWRTNLPTYGHLTWDRYVLETLASKNYIIIKRAPVGAKKTKTGRHMCWMRTQLLWNNGSKWYPASATVNVFNQA